MPAVLYQLGLPVKTYPKSMSFVCAKQLAEGHPKSKSGRPENGFIFSSISPLLSPPAPQRLTEQKTRNGKSKLGKHLVADLTKTSS